MNRISGCVVGVLFFFLLGYPGLTEARSDEQKHTIGSTKELIDLIRTFSWDHEGPYTAKSIRLSGDIEMTRAVILTAKDIPVPATCLERDDCRHAVTMIIPKNMKDAQCIKTEDVLGTEHCIEARLLEKSIFRLRGKLVDTHPWRYNFIPVIEFVQASTDACKPGELQCAKDKTCWKHFNSYCRYCLERSAKECACRNEKGPLPDKTACAFFISGDLVCSGKCRNGLCDASDERCR